MGSGPAPPVRPGDFRKLQPGFLCLPSPGRTGDSIISDRLSARRSIQPEVRLSQALGAILRSTRPNNQSGRFGNPKKGPPLHHGNPVLHQLFKQHSPAGRRSATIRHSACGIKKTSLAPFVDSGRCGFYKDRSRHRSGGRKSRARP